MYDTAENGIDHSKNELDALSMKVEKNDNTVTKDYLLTKQLQNSIWSNLQEVNFKADKIKSSDFDASGVELTIKFHDHNPKVNEIQKTKKEKTILYKLWLFIVKQSITACFQWIIEHYQQFIP